ncbi:cytochrome oxidase assembly [Ramicandelaber brevisporus]|nr:cytochrome oxidase assembly [Ramicandelaber brevisporus]
MSSSTTAAPEQSKPSSDAAPEPTPAEVVPPAKPIVGYWLLMSAGLVFGVVVIGGLTRLTESGLSITEWNLIRGMRPPRSEEEWEEEFNKYKQFPEYILLNQHMTLPEFKRIFWYEWTHRMWGRAIGIAFLIPAAVFTFRKGYINSKALTKKIWAIGGLIGFQGFLGWYMVKSGLDSKIIEDKSHPRVSQYRLAAHLGSAFLIYLLMMNSGLGVLRANAFASGRITSAVKAMLDNTRTQGVKRFATGVAHLTFLTALSGAFVAGLDAGLIYDTFPLMGGRLVPPKDEIWSDDFAGPKSVSDGTVSTWSKWRNIFENPTLVQFNHRVLGTSTFFSVVALYFYARRAPLPPAARIALLTTLGIATAQASLGITTLLTGVPVPVAAAHQAGSLTLLTSASVLAMMLKKMPK